MNQPNPNWLYGTVEYKTTKFLSPDECAVIKDCSLFVKSLPASNKVRCLIVPNDKESNKYEWECIEQVIPIKDLNLIKSRTAIEATVEAPTETLQKTILASVLNEALKKGPFWIDYQCYPPYIQSPTKDQIREERIIIFGKRNKDYLTSRGRDAFKTSIHDFYSWVQDNYKIINSFPTITYLTPEELLTSTVHELRCSAVSTNLVAFELDLKRYVKHLGNIQDRTRDLIKSAKYLASIEKILDRSIENRPSLIGEKEIQLIENFLALLEEKKIEQHITDIKNQPRKF